MIIGEARKMPNTCKKQNNFMYYFLNVYTLQAGLQINFFPY